MKPKYIISVICLLALGGLALSSGRRITMRAISVLSAKPMPAFDCTAFDTTHLIQNKPDCNTANGSFTGLQGTGTGTLVFTWYDANGTILGHDAELTGIPAGVYRVKLTDDSKCPAVTMTFILHENNPLVIDNSTTVIKPQQTCNATDGSITNITVKNATQYAWANVNDLVTITNTKDLTNVAPGTYKLTVTNNNGCSLYAQYTVPVGNFAPQLVQYHTVDADCGPTGQFHATFNMKAGDPLFPYSIINVANSKVMFTGAIAYTPNDTARVEIPVMPGFPGLPAGTYALNVQGGTNCNTILAKFTIKHPVYKMDTSNIVVKPNVCGQLTGVILGIHVTGGPAPLSFIQDPNPDHGYFWYDSTGKQLSFKGSFLAGVTTGWYTVHAVNAQGCFSDTVRLFMPDSVSTAARPQLDDSKMCLPGRAKISVNNRDYAARYLLYDSAMNIIDSNRTGFFLHHVDVTSTYYVGAIHGICVSPLGRVTVTIVNPGIVIPNAFTPNNDGINDYWGIAGLDQYPGTEVTVFDRSGQRVYYSLNYGIPFDGRLNGKELTTGTYYYVIDTKKPGCTGGISGSVTIIR
jgi:gliding motility-associated-like protein